MSDQHPDVATLLDVIYDAATAHHLWPSVIAALARRLGSVAGILCGRSVASGATRFVHASRVSAASIRLYDTRHACNPWSLHIATQPAGSVVASDAVLPLAALRQTDFFADVLQPQGFAHAALVGLDVSDDTRAVLSLLRGPQEGPFCAAELDVMAAVTPHVRRALQLGYRVGAYRALHHVHHQVLNRLSVGIVVLDHAAQVVFANRTMRAWCAARSGLRLVLEPNGRARLSHTSASARGLLDRLVQSVLQGRRVASVGIPGDGGHQLVMVASAMAGADDVGFTGSVAAAPAVMLSVVDPAGGTDVPEDWLMQAYGLTRAEARVAIAAASGRTAPAVAGALGLSINTVKTHLRHVFAKTDTHGQVALAALIAPLRACSLGRASGGQGSHDDVDTDDDDRTNGYALPPGFDPFERRYARPGAARVHIST
ncbi:MAG TPA: LuxR C-terminal-related transcriptional regulator [Vineibacter sp.]|nr:LuxR C-terminal-related transcriptional regulator [Vineibacter sp.]